MVIATAAISIGTLHAIVGAVLVVIGVSRIVRVGRAIGERLQQQSDGHDRLEGASGVG